VVVVFQHVSKRVELGDNHRGRLVGRWAWLALVELKESSDLCPCAFTLHSARAKHACQVGFCLNHESDMRCLEMEQWSRTIIGVVKDENIRVVECWVVDMNAKWSGLDRDKFNLVADLQTEKL